VTNCNTTQHTVTQRNTLQHTATHCKTLQHTAKHCNTLQERGTYYNHQERHAESSQRHGDFLGEPLTTFASPAHPLGCLCLQCVAVCCSVLQCVVACGSVLQREYVVPYKDPVHKRPIVSFVPKLNYIAPVATKPPQHSCQMMVLGAHFFFWLRPQEQPFLYSLSCLCVHFVGVCWCMLVCVGVYCGVLQCAPGCCCDLHTPGLSLIHMSHASYIYDTTPL